MDDLLELLCRTGRIHAVRIAFETDPNEWLTTVRTAGREGPRLCPLLARFDDGTDDLGNHVARLAHDNQISGTNILRGDLVLIVQCRHGNR